MEQTKGQKTQELIIKTALELVGSHGFSNTSMQMIASACKLSQGAVMQHFPSKARLFEAIRKSVSKDNHSFIDPQILPTDDGFTCLRKHITLNLDWALRNRAQFAIIILTYESGIRDLESREIANGAIELGTERILRYILAAQREKIVSNEIDAELTAQLCHEYIVGICLRTVSSSKSTKVTKPLEDHIHYFLKNLFRPVGY